MTKQQGADMPEYFGLVQALRVQAKVFLEKFGGEMWQNEAADAIEELLKRADQTAPETVEGLGEALDNFDMGDLIRSCDKGKRASIYLNKIIKAARLYHSTQGHEVDVEALKREWYGDSPIACRASIDRAFDHLTANGFKIVKVGE